MDSSATKTMAPRDIYAHKGLNKDLLHERVPSSQGQLRPASVGEIRLSIAVGLCFSGQR